MRRRAMLVVAAVVGTLAVGSGVALAANVTCGTNPCLGTPDPDTITGDSNFNDINAFAGDDVVSAYGGNDVVFGDEGNDIVDGFSGNDNIYGGPDGDGSAQAKSFGSLNLEGSEDSDAVYGEDGNDWIDAAANDAPSASQTEPIDSSYGGGGNDHIKANDGNVDYIYCGKGKRDVAIIDKGIDITTGCEKKKSG